MYTFACAPCAYGRMAENPKTPEGVPGKVRVPPKPQRRAVGVAARSDGPAQRSRLQSAAERHLVERRTGLRVGARGGRRSRDA
jgi:hypothetical protein